MGERWARFIFHSKPAAERRSWRRKSGLSYSILDFKVLPRLFSSIIDILALDFKISSLFSFPYLNIADYIDRFYLKDFIINWDIMRI